MQPAVSAFLFSSMRIAELSSLGREDLAAFVVANVKRLSEDEALSVLDNAYVTPQVCQMVAQTQRLVAFYSIRLRLVMHRATPQAHAVKLVHYLYWSDLVRLSVDVKIAAPVRRAIDTQLLLKVSKLTLGEKITSAKRCSPALIRALLFDPDPRVFAALLINQRLREDDLVMLANSDRASAEQLQILGSDVKWSYRYAIRKALVLNPVTPRAVAASQLRFLRRHDLLQIHRNPDTSVYLRRCIERLQPATRREIERGESQPPSA